MSAARSGQTLQLLSRKISEYPPTRAPGFFHIGTISDLFLTYQQQGIRKIACTQNAINFIANYPVAKWQNKGRTS
jgi:hypothetical protein